MKSLTFRLGLATAAVALLASPALAQKPGESGGSPAAERPVAVERGPAVSGDSGNRSAAPVPASSGFSDVSASSPSAASAAMPSMGFGSSARAAYREEAPQHRTSGGNASGGQAVPRGSSGGSASSGSSSGSMGSTPARQGSNTNRDNGSRAVPDWARPRGDRPSNDTAVQRTTPRPDGHGFIYGRYYDPFGFYYGAPYYGNYFYGGNYYSPYFYSPFMLGYGWGLGFPMDPWSVGDPYFYGGGGGGDYGYTQPARNEDQGSLRLKLKPRDAKVYVDNYFVGTVDSMDGVFQKLPLNGGRHQVTVKADGYEPEQFDVMITPNETVTYQGDLKRIK
jgi:hypothetical protein